MYSLTNTHLDPLVNNLGGFSFMSPHASALMRALDVLQIDIPVLKKIAFGGLPDEPIGIRGLVWRILLKYLPEETEDWESTLSIRRQNYEDFKSEFLQLNDGKAEKDDELWEIIEKDVRRTRQDMHFFFTPSDSSLTYHDILLSSIPSRKYGHPYITGYVEIFGDIANDYLREIMNNPDIEKHADVVSRILMIFAKLNPGLKYVQGMNELLAPIYYLFAHDTHPLFQGHAEADAFFCFNHLVSTIRDTFVNSLDSTESGLDGQLQRLGRLIQRHDYEIHAMLEDLKISTHFFGLKWIVLLLSQELSLPDVFRLWDCLFTTNDPFEFLHYVCLVLVVRVKADIMTGDFATALHSIQKPDIISISEIIEAAQYYYNLDLET